MKLNASIRIKESQEDIIMTKEYTKLFNTITDTIEHLEDLIEDLKNKQIEVEESIISAAETSSRV